MPKKTKEQSELKIEKRVVESTTNPVKTTKNANSKNTSVKSKVADTTLKTKKSTNTKKVGSVASTKKSNKGTNLEKSIKQKNSISKKATINSIKTKSETTKKSKSSDTKKGNSKIKASTIVEEVKDTISKPRKTIKKSTTILKSKNLLDFNKNLDIVEYYDLPYRYNKTLVKVLAQTPTNLFVYWDISDKDRENYKKQYGDNFFETTKPVLIIHNDSLGYSFEIEINDFANSWYLHVNDSKCSYRIELGRRPINHLANREKINTDYIYISQSNEIESPNDRILLDSNQKLIHFKNVKTNQEYSMSLLDLKLQKSIEKIYNIYDLYKIIYENEVENIYDLSNPTSGNPSSINLSSKFK